ncbi:hypothetical protein FACS1894188_11080 [Clostridia bacterium]|nr:hypothetical protein FACS1894188_11080 [Clostridia bacterium]
MRKVLLVLCLFLTACASHPPQAVSKPSSFDYMKLSDAQKEEYAVLKEYERVQAAEVDEYSKLLRNIGLSKNAEELGQILDETIKDCRLSLNVYTKLLPTAFPLLYSTNDYEKILTHLKASASADFPEIDSDYIIKYVPKDKGRLYPVAFYGGGNELYINQYSYSEGEILFTTLAREAYPGRLYQAAYSEDKPPVVREIAENYKSYINGYSAYAEYYSYKWSELPPEYIKAAQNMMLLSLCEAAKKELDERKPPHYVSYAGGLLEILELKETVDYPDKDFHEFLLGQAAFPFDTIKSNLNVWIFLKWLEKNNPSQ